MTIQTQRSITMPGIWAKNAATTIPNPPIPGQAYRNPSLDKATIEAGQAYSSRADSAQWNQWNYSCSVLESEIERYGVLPYSPLTAYPVDGICLGDGAIYQAIQENGPGTTIGAVTPGNEAVWRVIVNPSEVFLKYTFVTNDNPVKIFVNLTTGVDDINGGSQSSPLKTFDFALQVAATKYIVAGERALQIYFTNSGTYTPSFRYLYSPLFVKGYLSIQPAPGDSYFNIGSLMWVRMCPAHIISANFTQGTSQTNVGISTGIMSFYSCSFNVGPNGIGIQSGNFSDIYLEGCSFTLTNSYCAVFADTKSFIHFSTGPAHSINGSVTTAGGSVSTSNYGQLIAYGATITGNVTGKRYVGTTFGFFVTYNPTIFPGSENGILTTGALYV